MMRIFILLTVFCFIVQAQKRFTTDYFVSKFNLKLPEITQEMLDISNLTRTSELWKYYYKGETDKLDSITISEYSNSPSQSIVTYAYKKDTTIERRITILLKKGDTLINYYRVLDNNSRTMETLNLLNQCINLKKYDKLGIKLLDHTICPYDTKLRYKIYNNINQNEYIESIVTNQDEIDSSSIERYYLTPFDSIVACLRVQKGKEPFFDYLKIFNEHKKEQVYFYFCGYTPYNEVLYFLFYTYIDTEKIHREFNFVVEDFKAKDRSYKLYSYTEYEYDNLGRKTRTTTRIANPE